MQVIRLRSNAMLKSAEKTGTNEYTLVITVSAALVNGFFTHNGATVLFYLGPNRITKEAFCYGAVMALMIAAVIFWFGSFGVLMTADKMIYLFIRLYLVLF